jgi:hypothetical protein
VEVIEVLGERQFGDGELVFDRARLLLADFGVEQIADDALRFILALDSCSSEWLLSIRPLWKKYIRAGTCFSSMCASRTA